MYIYRTSFAYTHTHKHTQPSQPLQTEEALKDDYTRLVGLQHEIAEDVKFTKDSVTNFNTTMGKGFWLRFFLTSCSSPFPPPSYHHGHGVLCPGYLMCSCLFACACSCWCECVCVCKYVCMYIYAYVYIHIYICIYIYMYRHICVYTYIYIYACYYTYMQYAYEYVYLCIYMSVHVYICICKYLHVYVCECTYASVPMYIYAYAYSNTNIYTYTCTCTYHTYLVCMMFATSRNLGFVYLCIQNIFLHLYKL